MKKLLLLSTLALGGLVANADYSEYFKVYYNGVEYPTDSTIECDEAIESDGALRYEADITVINLLDYSYPLEADLINAEGNETGTPSLCFNTIAETFNKQTEEWSTYPDSNCFPFLPNVCTLNPEILPNTGVESNFFWQAEALGVQPGEEAIMVLSFYPCVGSIDYYEIIEDALYTMKIKFANGGAGVEGIDSDSNAAPVYYNLQGLRVDEPVKGIYIVKQGNKTVKKIFK